MAAAELDDQISAVDAGESGLEETEDPDVASLLMMTRAILQPMAI